MTINATAYPLIVEPLSEDDGGGFETPEEAVVNARDAILQRIEAARDLGHAVPPPSRRLALAG